MSKGGIMKLRLASYSTLSFASHQLEQVLHNSDLGTAAQTIHQVSISQASLTWLQNFFTLTTVAQATIEDTTQEIKLTGPPAVIRIKLLPMKSVFFSFLQPQLRIAELLPSYPILIAVSPEEKRRSSLWLRLTSRSSQFGEAESSQPFDGSLLD